MISVAASVRPSQYIRLGYGNSLISERRIHSHIAPVRVATARAKSKVKGKAQRGMDDPCLSINLVLHFDAHHSRDSAATSTNPFTSGEYRTG
jgi:hypothetical protein